MPESIEQMLTGGHPNSLGRVEEVVSVILEDDPTRIQELYETYKSEDDVVRLRVSSCFKRITRGKPDMMLPYIDKFLTEIKDLDQASAQWSIAEIMGWMEPRLTPDQLKAAKDHLKYNLVNHDDWIVLNHTMQILSDWSMDDPELFQWIRPQLERLTADPRKSVANRAGKLLKSRH